MSINPDNQQNVAEHRSGEGRAPAPIELPAGGAQLLGFTAQADLVDFEMLTASAPMAPTLSQRIDVATLAADQFGRFERIGEQIAAQNLVLTEVLRPYREALDAFARATRARDWAACALRALLVNGLRADFIAAIRDRLDGRLAALIEPGPGAWRISDFVGRALSEALDADPASAGALALYGRRFAAEAIGQIQRLVAREVELTSLVAHAAVGNGAVTSAGDELGVVSELLERLMAGHAKRLARLGLGS
ncbi:ferritin-like fold-containing protein [uncultured Propionibacterium sp.]|uniref:ferritin-like fold-containing protein n=1 Tax=uncultured Propionibacterium sp. TaxID=218066 RepID=UPI0029312F9E|nr:ferritin-like fold-containing protein [uncultured Propionibacterium sp.]